ncbi:MAG: 50S ribosomal protein L29 [Legionellales bacterium]|nr:50S ribosomal protein L29 [Legionellales bacterium]
MKVSDLKNKSEAELQQEITSLLKEQFNLRMQRGSGQPIKSHRFKEIRKMVARIKTILHTQKIENN